MEAIRDMSKMYQANKPLAKTFSIFKLYKYNFRSTWKVDNSQNSLKFCRDSQSQDSGASHLWLHSTGLQTTQPPPYKPRPSKPQAECVHKRTVSVLCALEDQPRKEATPALEAQGMPGF